MLEQGNRIQTAKTAHIARRLKKEVQSGYSVHTQDGQDAKDAATRYRSYNGCLLGEWI